MKSFKIADVCISTAMIITFFVLSIIDAQYILVGYLVVGSWQVISMIVHTANRCFTAKSGIRNIYHWITFISLITFPLGSFWILAFAAPFMAVFYTVICYDETFRKMRRPLSLLK